MRPLSILAAAAVAVAPAGAAAQTRTTTTAGLPTVAREDMMMPTEGAKTLRWYGWHSFAIDGAAVLTFVATAVALAREGASDAWLPVAGLPYIVGTPIDHVSHGNIGAALLTGGLRLLVPAGAYVGARFTCDTAFCEGKTTSQIFLWGGLIGTLVLIPIIDAALLAWERI